MGGFAVRTLSENSPICVSSGGDTGAPASMSYNEERPLGNGDMISVNPKPGSTLWLVFRDLIGCRPRVESRDTAGLAKQIGWDAIPPMLVSGSACESRKK